MSREGEQWGTLKSIFGGPFNCTFSKTNDELRQKHECFSQVNNIYKQIDSIMESEYPSFRPLKYLDFQGDTVQCRKCPVKGPPERLSGSTSDQECHCQVDDS